MQKREKTWEHFLFWSSFKTKKEDQSQKRQVGKGQTFIKKIRKNVIVKDEEVDKRREASNQENENIEFGQWVNVEGSKFLQSEMKEVEPVEDILLTKSNQGEEEDVKE